MAMTPDTKLKLTAGVYGHYVTNADVKNPNDPNFGYQPSLGQGVSHEVWIKGLLSGDSNQIKQALAKVEIADPGEQQNVIDALPKGTDREIALALYLKLKDDFAHFKKAAEASSHDY